MKDQIFKIVHDPELWPELKAIARTSAARAHALSGHEQDRLARDTARELTAKLWAEDPPISKAAMARDIIGILKVSGFKEYKQVSVERWIQDLNPNRRTP